ncbi:hypothetical protein OAF05_00995 [bacterium]|nr:hypothetical protein [bacterium]
MNYSLIKIVGLEYSGTTLCDLLISSIFDDFISLGEVERSVGRENYNKNYICGCGDPDCVYWSHRNLEYRQFLEMSLTRTSLVDSSKTRTSLSRFTNKNTSVVFIYKNCFDWCLSCLSRYFILEVKPWKSSTPQKYIIPFLRIELLRRLIIFLPLEWLFRNIHLLMYAYKLCAKQQLSFYIISLHDLTSAYQGFEIKSSSNHILRGNKISRRKATKIKKKSRKIKIFNILKLFDFIFDFVLSKLPKQDPFFKLIE